jgi:hypothetical protein
MPEGSALLQHRSLGQQHPACNTQPPPTASSHARPNFPSRSKPLVWSVGGPSQQPQVLRTCLTHPSRGIKHTRTHTMHQHQQQLQRSRGAAARAPAASSSCTRVVRTRHASSSRSSSRSRQLTAAGASSVEQQQSSTADVGSLLIAPDATRLIGNTPMVRPAGCCVCSCTRCCWAAASAAAAAVVLRHSLHCLRVRVCLHACMLVPTPHSRVPP